MAPIRRYLKITKYSVLECRIYLDNPALAHSWLLNPRDPVLPRVIDSIRPLVLPKLREEKERAKKKSTKKRGIKDVIVEDDFEVSIFITETSTRHSLLYKHKHFRDKTQTKLVSNSNKLTGASRDAPIDVEDQDLHIDLSPPDTDHDPDNIPALRREDSDEDAVVALDDIPTIDEATGPSAPTRQSKRRRQRQRGSTAAAATVIPDSSDEEADDTDNDEFDDDDDSADSAADEDEDPEQPPSKRRRDDHGEKDDKKKLAMDISYEGFAIYGRVLCLVVKRRETLVRSSSGLLTTSTAGGRAQSPATAALGGQAVMENWITSTQMVPAEATSAEADG